jgi:HTH-type transcriptional regulator/antitoxin HipB
MLSKAMGSDGKSAAEPAVALGEALRDRRRQLGLNQRQLGRLAGVGVAFLYELEHGKPTVRLDKVLAVLEVLGLELCLRPGRGGRIVAVQAPAASP